MGATPFDDLLAANAAYADGFGHADLEGRARAGVAILTCMDARIDPLALLGLDVGDAKVLRNGGGRVTEETLEGLILAVNLLDCRRVLVVEHTRCAVASSTEAELRERVERATGRDASAQPFPSIDDQCQRLRDDVATVRDHTLVPAEVSVGGFIYDVDTGRLEQVV